MNVHQYQHKVQYYEKPIKWEWYIILTIFAGLRKHAPIIWRRWACRIIRWRQRALAVRFLSVQCQYKSKVVYGETVTIQVALKSYSGLRMTIVYTVSGSDGKVLYWRNRSLFYQSKWKTCHIGQSKAGLG